MPEIDCTAMSGRSEKVAVVMSSRMKNEEDIIKELQRIKVDMDVLAKSNSGSCWFIRAELVDDALVSFFTKIASIKGVIGAHIQIHVNAARPNKF
eukprot:2714744-Ditylum_brightwellii.AAC.1